MVEDLENDKWVEAHIGLMTPSAGIIQVKKDLEEYAKELEWKISVDKKGFVDEQGNRVYNIRVSPKDEKISPEELREKRDLIDGFSISVLRDIIYAERSDNLPKRVYVKWTPYRNKDKKDMLNISFSDVFIIDIDLKRAIKLEIQNSNLFKRAFGISLKKWYEDNLDKKDRLFISSEQRERAEAIIQLLENNGMPKATNKKKSILKRLF